MRVPLLPLLLVAASLAGCVDAALDGLAAEPAPARRAPPAAGELRVHVVDVGQGDGTIWELPGGGVVVYDCGPPSDDAAGNPMVRALRGLGLARGAEIHALVASHGHLDHVGGCEEVLLEYEVRHVVEAWFEGHGRPASYLRFLDQVRLEGAQVHTLDPTDALEGEREFGAGDALPLPPAAQEAGVEARIVWPPRFQDNQWESIAESSVVVRLSHGANAFCFQGDIETAQEAALAASPGDLACDAYLVGHHGSRTASSDTWLRRMDPEVAVASFGENTYGHPTAEALCRVQEAGARVYATHRVGTVTLTSSAGGLAVSPNAPETRDYCAPGASYWGP